MKKVLIGSQAAKFWFPDFYREPRDTDFIVNTPEKSTNPEVEYLYHPVMADWINSEDFLAGNAISGFVASPVQLYTLKVSHSFWALLNRSWSKHMKDIAWFQENGRDRFDYELYEKFYAVWEEKHGKKKANLNVSAEDFFTKTVDRKFDHDSIHASIAYGDEPMYKRILRDGAEVAVAQEKFEALSHEDRLRLVREEVYATALERVLIPSDYEENAKRAYNFALFKTITSFSKGWFPLWIVRNFNELKKPDIDYVQAHLDNKDKLILLED